MPEHRPKNEMDWEMLETIIDGLARFAPRINGDILRASKFESRQERITKMFACSQRREILFDRLRELCQMNINLESGKAWLHEHLDDVSDFWTTLHSAMKWHCYDYPDSHGKSASNITKFVDDWVCTQSLQQIIKLSSDWHTLIQVELQNATSEKYFSPVFTPHLSISSGWPVVLKTPFSFEGYKLIELANEHELILEGQSMRHCVGTYGDRCSQGNSLIFSVQNMAELKLTTLELAISGETEILDIVSHKGIRNANPGDECKKAAIALVEYLNTGVFSADIKNRINFQKVRRTISQEINVIKAERRNNYQRMAERMAWQCCFDSDVLE
jgi:hypothetical protein